MSVGVGYRRPPAPDLTGIDAGTAVRALTWSNTAQLANWILGRGAMVIPATFPGVSVAAGVKAQFFYRVRPRYQALQRCWCLTLRASATTTGVSADVTAGSGSAVTFGIPFGRGGRTIQVIETLSGQAEAEETLTIEVDPTGGTVIVESICCWEIPRAELTTGTSDDGTDTPRFSTSQPVLASNYTNLADVLTSDTKIGRRASLWQWAVPAKNNGTPITTYAKSTSSGTPAAIFSTLSVPMLTRKLGTSAVTGTVTWSVYAWVTAGTGTVYLTSTVNGNSSSRNITTTTPAWATVLTHTIDCEDIDSTDRRQTAASPAWDYVNLDASVSGGTLYIASVSVWET